MGTKLTSPTVVRDLLGRHGVRLQKGLGQHFLVDGNILARIVDLAEPHGDETAVEVGAGVGTLTVALAPHVRELLAVEVDGRLIPILAEQTASHPNVRVLRADFRELALDGFGERLLVVGNLPYGITSDVLVKLIRERAVVDRALLMVQAEVAEKLVAPPGREASRLGVHLRAYFEVEVVRRVPRTVFFPPPEVDSALIRLRKLPNPRIRAPEPAFERTLAVIFSGRRKTLRRALLSRLSAEEADQILAEVGLDGQVRGEALPLEVVDRLAHVLHRFRPAPSLPRTLREEGLKRAQMKVVYHGSPQGGLSMIVPAASTHGERWVYACKDPVMAALFLSGVGGDLTCAVGREEGTGLPFLCERFAGAVEVRYAGKRGSIYTLPADTFVEGRTGWEEELVCSVAVQPIAELAVEDVKNHLQELKERGLLRIYRYPSRPPDIPVDDEDLVLRGIVWAREKGESVLQAFQRYHPHLVGRIRQGLAAGRYPNRFPDHGTG